MKIKNAKLSVLILAGLIILSFAFFSAAQEKATTNENIFLDTDQDGLSDEEEITYGTDPDKADSDGDSYSDGAEVKSGYDPLKPAPGDNLNPEEEARMPDTSASAEQKNLTEELMDRVDSMVENSVTTGSEVDSADINEILQDMLQSKLSEEEVPEINIDEIKIKKQDYEKLTPEEKKIKEAEDFAKYITAVSYVISSNSPQPVTTSQDFQSLADSFVGGVTLAVTTGNTSGLNNLSSSAEKSLEQMKKVEVPEKDVGLHAKGLTFLNYGLTLGSDMQMNPVDPFSDLVKYTKMQTFIESVAGFSFEAADKFLQHGFDVSEEASLNTILNSPISATSNAIPALTITDPNIGGDTISQNETYKYIAYNLADTDDTVTVDFYFDTDNSDLDGTLISSCQNQAETNSGKCAWDTTGVAPGAYYIYGRGVNDGTNPEVTTYSTGTVTINPAPAEF